MEDADDNPDILPTGRDMVVFLEAATDEDLDMGDLQTMVATRSKRKKIIMNTMIYID